MVKFETSLSIEFDRLGSTLRDYPFLINLELINVDRRQLIPKNFLVNQHTIKTLRLKGNFKLDTDAIYNCNSLEKIIWTCESDKDAEPSISKSALNQLPALREVIFPKAMQSFSREFCKSCSGLRKVEYPETVKKTDEKITSFISYVPLLMRGVIEENGSIFHHDSIQPSITTEKCSLIAINMCSTEKSALKSLKSVTLLDEHLGEKPCYNGTTLNVKTNAIEAYASKGVDKASEADFESIWLRGLNPELEKQWNEDTNRWKFQSKS